MDDSFRGEEQTTPAGTIKAIDKGSVHRICSGQVVLTLATAVKELVENSIDAGATTVEVKLREYGSDTVEVIDNGPGVEEENFEGLTLKHHTSKLQDFSDLVGVETFGFRGEALSSLCALSGLTIVTRHCSADVGTRMEFDHNGRITHRVPQARQVGTTVILQNIFSTLPVRHREFQRNLRKEFAKMVHVLNSYCIISTGVRITCSNQTAKGQRSVVVASKGNGAMKDNISNVFGPKQVSSLHEFKQLDLTEEVSTEYGLKSASERSPFRLEGFISKCAHGQGRSSADRQYFFINKRPCDSTKLSKVVNEVYHQYNRHQYPFVALHVTMARDAVDVNVTPDKRQIFLQEEKLLLATIKTSLLGLYEPTTSVLQVNAVQTSLLAETWTKRSTNSVANKSSDEPPTTSVSSALGKLKRTFSSAFSKDDSKTLPISTSRSDAQESKQRRLDCFVTRTPVGKNIDTAGSRVSQEDGMPTDSDMGTATPSSGSESGFSSSQETLTFSSQGQRSRDTSTCSSQETEEGLILNSEGEISQKTLTIDSQGPESEEGMTLSSQGQGSQETLIWRSQGSAECCLSSRTECCDSSQTSDSEIQRNNYDVRSDALTSDSSLGTGNYGDQSVHRTSTDTSVPVVSVPDQRLHGNRDSRVEEDDSQVTVTQYDEVEVQDKHERTVKFGIENVRRKVAERRMSCSKKLGDQENFSRTFRASITPTDNQSAEEELQREITKDMFEKMTILGQFNLGFVIVGNGEDLFIVDQHATDEKYNFEELQKHTVLQSQRLIHPQNLELTASNETILIDNLEIFRKNGFDFLIDEQGPPTHRVKLMSTPVSRNWNFGKDDIEELIFMLSDSPGIMCRPSRVRQMFASRACRKSIMIGTALNHSEMKKLVTHMGEIDQPWNCPHGRPTMRHLINLKMVPR